MDIQTELDAIRSHLNAIEEEIKRNRREKTMRGYYNGSYDNAGDNGNFDVEAWNNSIKNDR